MELLTIHSQTPAENKFGKILDKAAEFLEREYRINYHSLKNTVRDLYLQYKGKRINRDVVREAIHRLFAYASLYIGVAKAYRALKKFAKTEFVMRVDYNLFTKITSKMRMVGLYSKENVVWSLINQRWPKIKQFIKDNQLIELKKCIKDKIDHFRGKEQAYPETIAMIAVATCLNALRIKLPLKVIGDMFNVPITARSYHRRELENLVSSKIK